MNRRRLAELSVVTLLTLVSWPGGGFAQQKSLKEQLIGTWTYVSSVNSSKEGVKSDRWGPTAKGLIIFEANGQYSFMISRSDIPKFAVNNVNQGTTTENKAAVIGIISHFGTWSVDEVHKDAHNERRSILLSQLEWQQPEAGDQFTHVGRAEVHQRCYDDRRKVRSGVEAD